MAPSVCGFLSVCEISRQPLNGFAPNSHVFCICFSKHGAAAVPCSSGTWLSRGGCDWSRDASRCPETAARSSSRRPLRQSVQHRQQLRRTGHRLRRGAPSTTAAATPSAAARSVVARRHRLDRRGRGPSAHRRRRRLGPTVARQAETASDRRQTSRCVQLLISKFTSGYAMVVHGRPKTPKNTILGVTQPPGVVQPLYSRGHN